MSDTQQLKMRALLARQDFSRLLDFRERFEGYLDALAACLADDRRDLKSITGLQLALENEYPDHRHRFVVQRSTLGEQVTPGIGRLIVDPASYVGKRDQFNGDAAQALARFDYLVRRDLRGLAELEEQIRLVADDAIASSLTGIAETERADVLKAVSKVDQLAEVAFKWGGRVIEIGGSLARFTNLLS